MKVRLVTALVALTLAGILTAGCGGGIGTLLRIAGVRALIPDSWSERGGFIKIVADIVTGSALDKVIARITHEDSDVVTEIILTRNAEGKYEGSFQAPANTDTATPETYTAVVEAVDTAGNTAESEPVTVEVPPADTTGTGQ